MTRALTLLTVSVTLLLVSAHRLPAPIAEETTPTPTPKPKQEATSKPKPKPEAVPKVKASPTHSFAGIWSGSTINSWSGDGKRESAVYVIKISDDEKTVLINWSLTGRTISGSDYQASCIRFGNTLTWNLKQVGENPTWVSTDTLRMNGDGTVTFIREGRWIGGDYLGNTYNNTGTLSRQGVSSPPSVAQPTPSAPQTTKAIVPPQTTGLPTAKPVPNKPGFVYNPFDPSSRVLLDVRGKTSGTKLIEPKSGKLFVVP
ncbi:MAG TPA: hypothetical protein VN827_03465 [Chthoniobacterales bacterium]|nr:hypothetical protein [Chthoniobacterales bacterium]